MKLTATIQEQHKPSQERKEYVCPRCSAEWTQLEALGRVGPQGLECDRCGALLALVQEMEKNGGSGGATARAERSAHEINSRLMAQLEPIVALLKQIDSMEIPANEFDTAFAHKVDVIRNLHTHPSGAATTAAAAAAKPTIVARNARPGGAGTVRGTAQDSLDNFEVSLASNAEMSAAEQAEMSARKAALEKQNALPAWHVSSTLAGESTAATDATDGKAAGAAVKEEVKEDVKEEGVKTEGGKAKAGADEGLDERVAAYYAAMAKEAEEDKKREEEEEEEESDEEDEFEDVTVGAGAGPAAGGEAGTGESATEKTTLKREYDEFAADNDEEKEEQEETVVKQEQEDS